MAELGQGLGLHEYTDAHLARLSTKVTIDRHLALKRHDAKERARLGEIEKAIDAEIDRRGKRLALGLFGGDAWLEDKTS